MLFKSWYRWKMSLSRRISLAVLLCIVVIEAALLVVSYFHERDRLIASVDQTIDVLLPAITPVYVDTLSLGTVQKAFANAQYPLVGITLRHPTGRSVQRGEVQGLQANVDTPTILVSTEEDTTWYERAIEISSVDSPDPVAAVLRFDISEIQNDLFSYVRRIVLIVLLIGAFVTAGCLLVLEPILLQPLARLGDVIRRAKQVGIADSPVPVELLQRQDEIGDILRSFDEMRSKFLVIDAENCANSERFQGFADLAADCFFETNTDRCFTFVAGKTEEMFGMRPNQMVGKSFADLVAQGSLPFSKPSEVIESLAQTGTWEGRLVATAGMRKSINVKMVRTKLLDSDGIQCGTRVVLTDTTLEADITRELTYRATRDGLTELINRTEFYRQLSEAIEGLDGGSERHCVFAMDLDRFKFVNDRCGHLAGDELLKQIAGIIRQAVRKSDSVARIGGDEFAVLLENCTLANALPVAEKVRSGIERMRFEWNGEQHALGVSVGVVELDQTYRSADDVVLAADSSCFQAKLQGRNQVCAHSPTAEIVKDRHEDLEWIARIESALQSNHCVLFQQPIIPIKKSGSDSVHFEVLVRLIDKEGVMISPGAFLPAAERNGYIDQVDRWVVSRVLVWLTEQKAPEELDLTVAVNLSGVSVADQDFQEFLVAEISSAKINPKHLCFEITETAAVQNLRSCAKFLGRIRELGCRVALDDFGTGFASLEYIKQLPLDFIKIDGAFIRDIAVNPLDQALVRCVADVARLLGVETVAEFVENKETVQALNELQIDFAQGYLFAEPRELSTLNEMLTLAATPQESVPAS